MKFLLDQDVYADTGKYLRRLGHDVVSAAQLGLSQASDEELLNIAGQQGRILLTRDRDYGNLVFVKGIAIALSIFACCLRQKTRYTKSLSGY